LLFVNATRSSPNSRIGFMPKVTGFAIPAEAFRKVSAQRSLEVAANEKMLRFSSGRRYKSMSFRLQL
jgi:hypothetical protein